MKKLRLLIIICILICGSLAIVACSGKTLNKPSNLMVSDDLRTLQWDSVSGASGYKVKIEGDETEYDSLRRYFDITNLTPEVEYTFRVKAVGDNLNFKDSQWSAPVTIYKLKESGLSFKYINNAAECELTGVGYADLSNGVLEVPSEYRGKPVTSVANSAFANNSRLQKIILPDTIKTIGSRAFQNCTVLTEVEMKEGVESIGSNAFRSCTVLEKVTIPNSVMSVGENGFAYCPLLSEVVFGNGLEEISRGCFRNCPSIKKIDFPDSVKYIFANAFYNCTGLEEVNLNKVEEIDESVFAKCSSLETVDFGTALMYLNADAFRDCVKLKKAILPDTFLAVGDDAFVGCSSLAEVDFGESAYLIAKGLLDGTKIYEDAVKSKDPCFYVGNWLVGVTPYMFETEFDAYDENGNAIHVTDNKPKDEVVMRKDTVGIALGVFTHDKNPIKHISWQDTDGTKHQDEFPPELRHIGPDAFAFCDLIEKVKFNAKLLRIQAYAFNGCTGLKEIEFAENSQLEVIEQEVFADCTKLGMSDSQNHKNPKQFTFPESLQTLGYDAFEGTYYDTYYSSEGRGNIVYVGGWVTDCTSDGILSANINPEVNNGIFENDTDDTSTGNIKTVGIADYVFYNCHDLKSAKIPDSVTKLGKGVFAECWSLSEVTLPNSEEITELPDYFFYHCQVLTSLNLPDKVKSNLERIGQSALYKTRLVSFEIPKNVTEIGDYAFYQSYGLRFLTFEEGSNLKSIGRAAFYMSQALEGVVLPDSLETIGDYAFASSSTLTGITFGRNVKSIGEFSFAMTSITEVTLPDSLTTVSKGAFSACKLLETVDLGSGVTTIGAGAFSNCSLLNSVEHTDNLKTIETSAFRGCQLLGSFKLGGSIESMGAHAFFDCGNLTFYSESDKLPDTYGYLFNSSFCPIVLGSTYSDDGSYVESFTIDKDNLLYLYSKNTITAPGRSGYVFAGWQGSNGVLYDDPNDENSPSVLTAPDGTVLTSTWELAPVDEGEE